MKDDKANAPATEGFQEKHKDDLSATRYGLKKLYEFAVTFGGIFGGGFIGHLTGGRFAKRTEMLEGISQALTGGHGGPKARGALLGSFLGAMVSSVVLAYEHWVKEESTKLAVGEINNDIANIKIRQRTDPELLKENDRLRAMLAEEEKKTEALRQQAPETDAPSPRIATQGHEHATPEPAMEMAAGRA